MLVDGYPTAYSSYPAMTQHQGLDQVQRFAHKEHARQVAVSAEWLAIKAALRPERLLFHR